MLSLRTTASNQPVWRAMMVTDLVQFTHILDLLGDTEGVSLMRSHNRLLRACLQRYGGSEYAHTGDGIIASFPDPCLAVRCAMAVQRQLAQLTSSTSELALRARIGVHVGRPLLDEGRLFGKCVNEAVRVCAQADSNQIFASHALKESVVCPELVKAFKPQGLRCLKGVARPQALYEVQWTRLAEQPACVQQPVQMKLSAA